MPVNDITTVRLENLLRLARPGEAMSLSPVNIRALHSGGYLSPFKGRGMEFDESRPYQPGDDVRNLDWKVTARTGRPHTKLFREERERPVLLWLDLRRPMFFATHGVYKAVTAAYAATLLAWSTAAHRDRLGGLIFSETDHHELKPANGKTAVLRYLKTLCRHPQWTANGGDADPAIPAAQSARAAVLRLNNVARPGSLVFMLSDFRGFDAGLEPHLGAIARHNNVVLIHVYDPLEAELPPAGQYDIQDRDGTRRIDTADAEHRRQYRLRFDTQREYLQTLCRRFRMFYLDCRTTDEPVARLQHGLGLKK